MITDFPKKINFVHDDTIAILVGEIPKAKERSANYKFIKAKVNLDKEFSLTIFQVQRLLTDKSIICQ